MARFTLTQFMGKSTCKSKATQAVFNIMQTIELPCLLCELQGALMNLRKPLKLASDEAAAQYLIERLPHGPDVLSRVRLSLGGQLWKSLDFHTGLDIMRATAVTKSCLRGQNRPCEDNALGALRSNRMEFGLPVLHCEYCGAAPVKSL